MAAALLILIEHHTMGPPTSASPAGHQLTSAGCTWSFVLCCYIFFFRSKIGLCRSAVCRMIKLLPPPAALAPLGGYSAPPLDAARRRLSEHPQFISPFPQLLKLGCAIADFANQSINSLAGDIKGTCNYGKKSSKQ